MSLTQKLVDGLDIALNESRVCGLVHEAASDEVRLLLEVLALPPGGPIDADGRRVIVLGGLEAIEVDLFSGQSGIESDVTRLPLASLDDVEAFFQSLEWWNEMYGWSFIDSPNRTHPWPEHPSLKLKLRSRPAAHTLEWFTECGGETESYLLRGVVRFEDFRVTRADGTPLTVEHFIADARRWWGAFYGKDEQLSVRAQRSAGLSTVRWRANGTITGSIVPARDNPGPGV